VLHRPVEPTTLSGHFGASDELLLATLSDLGYCLWGIPDRRSVGSFLTHHIDVIGHLCPVTL
jgi:hypothetical protein